MNATLNVIAMATRIIWRDNRPAKEPRTVVKDAGQESIQGIPANVPFTRTERNGRDNRERTSVEIPDRVLKESFASFDRIRRNVNCVTVRESWLRRWRGRTVQGARAMRLEICLAHAFSLLSSRLGLKRFRVLSTNYRIIEAASCKQRSIRGCLASG